MPVSDYYQRQAASLRSRQIRVVKSDQQQGNETPAAKQYRLIEATVRSFAQEFPERALQIVKEATGLVK